MKISNSKKELARIINENGGWRDVADWAAQDEVVAFFSGGKPEYASHDKVWYTNGDDGSFIRSIGANDKIKCFHNTILSREEYFHLYPAPDAKAEFCESVTRSIAEPESKPTIEQLAADYRNRKDYADRKQEEADAAKADAESKLAELVSAGKAIGLVVSVAEPEPEVVITDWRDLQVGDIVKVVGSDNCQWKRLDGLELRITIVGNRESDLVFTPSDGEDWLHGGNTQWIFIRRP